MMKEVLYSAASLPLAITKCPLTDGIGKTFSRIRLLFALIGVAACYFKISKMMVARREKTAVKLMKKHQEKNTFKFKRSEFDALQAYMYKNHGVDLDNYLVHSDKDHVFLYDKKGLEVYSGMRIALELLLAGSALCVIKTITK